MANLLNCTDIAIVFLDTRLQIRRFTLPATRVMNLVDTDIGRAINEIRLKFADNDLVSDAEAVVRTLAPREKQVQTEDGHWQVRRITPFRTVENRIEGVLLSFVDVTPLKEAAVRANLLATILFNSSDAVIVFDLNGRITALESGQPRSCTATARRRRSSWTSGSSFPSRCGRNS